MKNQKYSSKGRRDKISGLTHVTTLWIGAMVLTSQAQAFDMWQMPGAGARPNYVEVAPRAKSVAAAVASPAALAGVVAKPANYVLQSSASQVALPARAGARVPTSEKVQPPVAESAEIKEIKKDFSAAPIKEVLQAVKTQGAIQSTPGRAATSPELKSKGGIPVFDLKAQETKERKAQTKGPFIPKIPQLDIGEERKISAKDLVLPTLDLKSISAPLVLKLNSQTVWTKNDDKLLKTHQPTAAAPAKEFGKSDLITQKEIDQIRQSLSELKLGGRTEPAMTFKEYKPLDQDEMDQLSALLLFKKGDECASAIPLFHHLAQKPKYKNESTYHIAVCSYKLGYTSEFFSQTIELLKLKDAEYLPEVLKLVGSEVPHDFKATYGKALLSAVEDSSLKVFENKAIKENTGLHLAFYGVLTEKPQITKTYSKWVSEGHEKSYQARYLEAIAEYMAGQSKKGIEVQDKLLQAFEQSKKDKEFSSLAAVNLARLQFQSGLFESAAKSFVKVQKDHPLWIQSLNEMGWAQIQSGDFAGAIGNMYSIHSPFFDMVYKPESYVIRTIGYLKLCQYGDAYKSLSILEKQYRPWMDSINQYMSGAAKSTYSTVKNYLKGDPKAQVDGLPAPVIREMARHKDFTNLQKSLNRNLDDQAAYEQLGANITKNIAKTKSLIASAKSRVEGFRAEIKSIGKNPKARPEVQVNADIQRDLKLIDSLQFLLSVHDRTQRLLPGFVKYANLQSVQRSNKIRTQIETILSQRMKRMKTELSTMLENNEFLRYEVFAGSGENIRHEVAGGEKAEKRVPASVVPKSKELRWSFDGEYWADEIGHYRSSLKSNCPKE